MKFENGYDPAAFNNQAYPWDLPMQLLTRDNAEFYEKDGTI